MKRNKAIVLKKKVNIRMIIAAFVSVLLVVSEGMLFYKLWVLDVLPGKFFAALAAGLLIVTVAVILFFFLAGRNKDRAGFMAVQVICIILAILLAGGSLTGYFVMQKLHETLDSISEEPNNGPVVVDQIGVYVLATDSAAKLEDTAGYAVGVCDQMNPYLGNTKLALDEIAKTLATPYKQYNYESVPALITALYNGEVRAIVLSVHQSDIMGDVEGFTDFASRTKRVYLHDIKETQGNPDAPVVPDVPGVTEETAVPPQVSDSIKDPFIVYLSGSDTRNKYLTTGRSDVNILAVVNPTTKQILLINTPRDYYLPNPALRNGLDKLTHCSNHGVDNTIKVLSNLYHQPIRYYARINFTGFETLVDAVGGVTIYSEKGDGVLLKPGANHMNGTKALEFARERHRYGDGDNARGRHQMQLIGAIVDKLTSGTMLTNYASIMDSLQGMFKTSMPTDLMTSYVKMQLSDMAHWDVFSYATTGTGAMKVTASMPGQRLSVYVPNQKTVNHASSLMSKVMNGQTLTEADIPLK